MAVGDNINGVSGTLALDATYNIVPSGADQYNIKNIGCNKPFELYYVDGATLTLFYADTTATGGALLSMDFRLTASHYIQVKAKAASATVSFDGFHWK